jgi:DNA-binding response OmpR family regulator
MERSVDVQIASIRKKLGAAGKLIKTVRGEGFRFQDV